MEKPKKEYRYMLCTRCWSSYFDDLQSAEDYAKSIQSDDVAIWVFAEDGYVVEPYGRDFDGTYEEDESVLNNKELLEKCKTNQPITGDDIGVFNDSALKLKSGEIICDNAIARGGNLSDNTKPKRKPHVYTQEERYKLKLLQKYKEQDLITFQTYYRHRHDGNNNDLYRILKERIMLYDKYMYAIETGNASSVNLELISQMDITEEESKKPVKSNKREDKPYDSLLDDEKSERINKCLNKL